jgi:hypothetical protein
METTPVTPAVRTTKVRTSKTAVLKSSSKAAVPAVKKAPALARKPKVLSKRISAAATSDLTPLIAVAAYYLAEQRQFVPGHELDDWLRAEQQLKAVTNSN